MSLKYDTLNNEIESIAERWYVDKDKNARGELMLRLYDERLQMYFFKKYRNSAAYNADSINKDDFSGIYLDAMLDIMESYKRERMDKFMPYFWMYMYPKILNRGEAKAIDKITDVGGIGEGPDDPPPPPKIIEVDTAVYLYMAIVNRLNMLLSTHSKRDFNNFKKLSMVHTDTTATFIKDLWGEESLHIISLIEQHRDDVYKVMDCEFMDYFTVDKCTTLRKLLETQLKKLGEIADVGETRRDKECPLPLEAAVYMKYYKLHNKIVDKTTISKQRKSYRDMISLMMEKDIIDG